MEVLLIACSCVSVFIAITCYFKSSQCADTENTNSNSQIGVYWLLAVISSALTLLITVTAFDVYTGTLVWLVIYGGILIPIFFIKPHKFLLDNH